jgi:hypothetical protein
MGQVASRFGQDAPRRIAASATMITEATAYLPGEPVYPALIPFYQGQVVSGSGALEPAFSVTSDGKQVWTKYPSRCDLTFYLGDDVVIPLYFQDPNNADMSVWQWEAQIRHYHSYNSSLFYDFSIATVLIPAEETDDPDTPLSEAFSITEVSLFMPRMLNTIPGVFTWEMYSISPYAYSNFPIPDGVEPEDWPPDDTLRTWLYGLCTILPRGSTTDYLPVVVEPAPALPMGWNGGWFVGPNGRVP